jgi:hypothetical protein
MAEVQALLHDHIEGGKHSAADVAAKAQANTPPDECSSEAALKAASKFDLLLFSLRAANAPITIPYPPRAAAITTRCSVACRLLDDRRGVLKLRVEARRTLRLGLRLGR